LARNETPYPLVRSCFIIFLGSLLFLAKNLFIAFSGSLGEASRGFILRLLSFTNFLLPFGPLAPSPHYIRCNPENRSTQCPDKWNGIGEWETRWKSDAVKGADDGFSEIPPSGKPKPIGTGLLGHPVKPPTHGQVGKCKIQAVVRNKMSQMHIFKGFDDQSDTYHDTWTNYLMEQGPSLP
jgi:hypothetical protein